MSFWSELKNFFSGSSGHARHAPGRHVRKSAGPPAATTATRSRAQTRAQYGPSGKQGTRTRAQLVDRLERQPKPYRGVAQVKPQLRQKVAQGGARATVSARAAQVNPRTGQSFAGRVRAQPAALWWDRG